MVGIGGRSRGCKTCRRARVKCDEGRPICRRCQRLKLECEPFNPFPVFIDGLSLVEIQSKDEEPKHSDENVMQLSLPRPLHPDQDDVFMVHLHQSLFARLEKDFESNSSEISPWLKEILQPNSQNRTPELAVRACAAAHYGKLYSHRPAIERGTKLYTQILRHLQRDLLNHDLAVHTTTLSTTILLALYEMITSSDMAGWSSHFLGIGQLIKFRGPQRHQSGVGQELFLTTRCSIVIAHLVTDKQCFLEEDAWQVVPWAANPQSKNTIDHLLDLFCDVPGILRDVHHSHNNCFPGVDRLTTSMILGHRIKGLIERLFNWRLTWETKFSSVYFNVGSEALRLWNVAHIDAYPFPTAIFFTSPERVSEICLYNAIYLILYRAWSRLPSFDLQALPFDGFAPSWPYPSILLAPGQGSIQDIVGEFCRVAYYQLLSFPGHSGAIQLIFPLQIAYRNASPGSDEARWLASIISHVADGHGFEAVRYSHRPTSANTSPCISRTP